MIRTLISIRRASTGAYKGASQISIPRRPLKKIRLGKARPAIYHQFDVHVELSDGSVIVRKSQFPKDQIRLIQDQRNNPLWNPSRDDLVIVDATAGGSLDKFKQRYSSIFSIEEDPKTPDNETAMKTKSEIPSKGEENAEIATEDTALEIDDYLSLLDDSSKQISTGKLATKKKPKK
ncbi:hypothetical protein HG535_0A01980 [Zygotorulaspora mrakii]|uniref:Ribosomal protein bL31m N-terminal domain-containing protein n=1 Tax=Zygotorulaspora mrakii TaxID=42260 RepID=A0A7H9AVA0_ZYGMR|nr:uncharacterized protein HG535_0A01980 [Zygotorulaspora mrakii]QLG70260.1 hypothetical protein HG535_0A01980 [Zygotorulaspora mrakii]